MLERRFGRHESNREPFPRPFASYKRSTTPLAPHATKAPRYEAGARHGKANHNGQLPIGGHL